MIPLTIADVAAAYEGGKDAATPADGLQTERDESDAHEAGLRAVVALVAARVQAAGYEREDAGYEAEKALRAALGDLADL